jgi:hypothetical protein
MAAAEEVAGVSVSTERDRCRSCQLSDISSQMTESNHELKQ